MGWHSDWKYRWKKSLNLWHCLELLFNSTFLYKFRFDLCTIIIHDFFYRKSLSKSKRVIKTPNTKSILFTNSNNISFSTKWNKGTRMSHFIDIPRQTRTSRIRVIFYLELPARIHLWIQGYSFHLRDLVRVSLQNG